MIWAFAPHILHIEAERQAQLDPKRNFAIQMAAQNKSLSGSTKTRILVRANRRHA
jgi:hypothetical protein